MSSKIPMGYPAVTAEVVERKCCHGGVPALCLQLALVPAYPRAAFLSLIERRELSPLACVAGGFFILLTGV